MMTKKLLVYLIALIVLGCLSCTTNPISSNGGSSSEVIAVVVGTITDSNGNPKPNVQVSLIPSLYNPVLDTTLSTVLFDTTNNSGSYCFEVNPNDSGMYNILATSLSAAEKCFVEKIAVKNDTTHVPASSVVKVGHLQLLIPDTVTTTAAYIYVEGTLLFKYLENNITPINDSVVALQLDSLPSGTLPSLNYDIINNPGHGATYADSVHILSNDTTIIDITPPMENKISGIVQHKDNGAPANNVLVSAYPKDYDIRKDGTLPECFSDTTDSMGAYEIKNITKGEYNLMIHDVSTGKRSLDHQFTVNDTSNLKLNADIKNTGTLKIIFADTFDVTNGYFYMAGTDCYLDLSNAQSEGINAYSAIFNTLPATNKLSLYYANTKNPSRSIYIDININVNADVTIIIKLTDIIKRRVQGLLLDHNSFPAENCEVLLIPSGYNPLVDGPLDQTYIDTTESNGLFRFDNTPVGTYSIEAFNRQNKTKAFLPEAVVNGDVVHKIPNMYLKETGVLKVFIPKELDRSNGALFFKGTTGLSMLSSAIDLGNNEFLLTIKNVIEGTHTSLLYDVSNDGASPRIIADTFAIITNDTTEINADMFWAHFSIHNSLLPNDSISGIIFDQNGVAWIGTAEHGVLSFDGKNWQTYTKTNSGLRSDQIKEITLGQDGKMYVANVIGVAEFDNGDWTQFANLSHNTTQLNNVIDIVVDSEGTKWFTSYGTGIAKMLRGSLTVENVFTTSITSDLASDTINNLDIQTDGDLLYSHGYKVAGYNGSSWYTPGMELGESQMDTQHAFITDRNDKFSFGLNHRGDNSVCLGGGIGSIYDSTDSPVLAHKVTALAHDDQDNYWCGTLGGLTRFDGTLWIDYVGKRFEHIHNKSITALGIDKDKNTWIGTASGEIIVFGPTPK